MGLQLRRKTSRKLSITSAFLVTAAIVAQPLVGIWHSGVASAATPAVQPCGTVATTATTNLSSWDLSQTRSRGHNELVSNGLHIWTQGNTSQDKAAGYFGTNFPLKDLGNATIAQSLDYAATHGTAPGLQLKVDFNNDGIVDGTLVGESVYGNSWWLSNDASQFVKDGAPNNGGGYGSAWYGTPNEWLSKFPDAQVRSIGYSLGSGVHGDGVIKSVTLGCVKYTFSKAPLAAPALLSPLNNAVQRGDTLTNSWTSIPGAASYEYQSYNNAAMTSVRWTQTVTGTSKSATKVADGTFWWRVRAIDVGGDKGTWSPLWKVTVDNVPPTVPQGGVPNGTTKTTNDFDFKWNPSADASAVTYEFQSTQDPARTNGVLTNSLWHSGVLPTPMIHSSGAPDGIWYWQVRAVDAAGNKSAWSSVWAMTIDSHGPDLVVNNPTEGQIFGGGNLTVHVNATATDPSGLSAYYVAFDGHGKGYKFKPRQGAMPMFDINLNGVAEGDHTILVRATDMYAHATEVKRHITVDNTAPIISTPIVDGQTLAGTASIEMMLDELHPKVYDIRVLDTNGNVVTVNGVAVGKYDDNNTTNSFTYDWDTTQVPNGTYKIQFSAWDAAGNPATTIYRTVQVVQPVVVPPSVTIRGIQDGIVSGTVSDPTAILTAVIDDTDRTGIVFTLDGNTWSFKLPKDVMDNLTHTVKVRATLNGASQESEMSTFKIAFGGSGSSEPGAFTVDPVLQQLSSILNQPFTIPASFGTPITRPAAQAAALPVANDQGVLGTQTSKDPMTDQNSKLAAVPTKEGWKIFGVAWYWWVVIAAFAVGLWQLVARARKQSTL